MFKFITNFFKRQSGNTLNRPVIIITTPEPPVSTPQITTVSPLDFSHKDIPELNLRVKTTHVTRREFLALSPETSLKELWGSELSLNAPVTHATWDQVNEWISTLNAQTNSTWRLPSAEEVKAIALLGRTELPKNEDLLRQEAVVWENSGGVLNPVASKQSNQYGIFDVVGNVWTWCRDIEEKIESNGQFKYPVATIVGGSYFYSAKSCSELLVTQMWRECKSNDIGFRLVSNI